MADDLRTDAKVGAARMPFGDHLEELRRCLFSALAGAALCTIVSLVFAKEILQFITKTGRAWTSDIANELQLDLDLVMSVLRELRDEGKVAPDDSA